MLIEFRVKNFKSFRDEQIFSMVANAESDFPQNTFSHPVIPKNKLLTSAAFYGANASGKSNLVHALRFVKDFVLHSDNNKVGGKISLKPFCLDLDSQNQPSEFEVTFIQENVRYRYGFVVNSERILEEWLIAYPNPRGAGQTWFERSIYLEGKADFEKDQEKWKFGASLIGDKKRLADYTRPNVLFLTQAVKLDHKQLAQVYQWFDQILQVIYANKLPETLTLASLQHDQQLGQEITQLLREADVGINGYSIEEKEFEEQDLVEDTPEPIRNIIGNFNKSMRELGAKNLNLRLHHTNVDTELEIPFALQDESFGTLKLLERGGPILYALKQGQVLVIDELDASLHPLLLRKLIIKPFNDKAKNPKGAQLIFNTHNTSLLDNNFDEPLLQRDQIWLVQKDRSGASKIYSLLDFRPRKEEAFQKNYLQGRYGAIPVITDLISVGDND